MLYWLFVCQAHGGVLVPPTPLEKALRNRAVVSEIGHLVSRWNFNSQWRFHEIFFAAF